LLSAYTDEFNIIDVMLRDANLEGSVGASFSGWNHIISGTIWTPSPYDASWLKNKYRIL